MNNPRQDYKIKLLLMLEVIAIIFLYAFTHAFLTVDAVMITIISGLSGAVITYSICQYKHMKRLSDYHQNFQEYLDYLDKDTTDNISPEMKPLRFADMEDVAKRVIHIKESQRLKDQNRQRILNIVNSIAASIDLEKLLDDLMPKLIDVTQSNCGVFYLTNHATNKLEIKKSSGFSKNIYSEFDLTLGEGFIGIPAQNKETKIITEIPNDTIYLMRTFLGKVKPKSIMVVPLVNQEQVVGVFAFASIHAYSAVQLEMVDLIKYYVGAAVGNCIVYDKTKRLTNELKFQNRLIQNLNDELEKKVEDRTSFLNDIIDSVRDYAIYAMDRNGIVTVWNKGAEYLFGYTAKETIGKHIDNVYPADEVRAGYVQKWIEAVARDGRYTESGWRFRKDGTSYYADMMLFARYNQNGEIVSFTNVTKDITELKTTEGNLWFEKEFSNKLIESSAKAMVFTDEEGYVKHYNTRAVLLLGSDLYEGRLFYDFFDDVHKMRECADLMMESGYDAQWEFKLAQTGEAVHIKASALLNEVNYSKTLFLTIEVIPSELQEER